MMKTDIRKKSEDAVLQMLKREKGGDKPRKTGDFYNLKKRRKQTLS